MIGILGLLSCQNDDDEDDNSHYNVHEFVQTVKDGKYESMNLPDFKPNDIPLLLAYANDFEEIPRFPTNPISSYYPPIFRLGECLLWTIESIKLNYDKDRKNFPSNVPLLIKDGFGNDPESGMLNDQELGEVYNLYFDWWSNNYNQDFDTFRYYDILKDTGYGWR